MGISLILSNKIFLIGKQTCCIVPCYAKVCGIQEENGIHQNYTRTHTQSEMEKSKVEKFLNG